MPVRQYVYFALFSRHTPAAEMTALLGVEPDEVTVRGSRSTAPAVVPVSHSWQIVCREPGLRVDEQAARVVDRLRHRTAPIAELARRLAAEEGGAGGAVLEVVRYFNEAGQDQRSHRPADADTPDLLGWHLDRGVLDFLAATGAALDVDEYDMAPDGPRG